jgi:3-hydroxybutyrate dehydrogenase
MMITLPPDYRPTEDEEFMNPIQVEYFRQKLLRWRTDLLKEADGTLASLSQGGIHESDITDRASVEAGVAAFEQDVGPVDFLANIAGWDTMRNFLDTDVALWDKIIRINLYGPLHTHHAICPLMVQRGGGRIINIASAHGLVASGEKVGYVAAKHGLVGLTKVVAIETANSGVTCNAICPGWVLTPLVQQQVDARAKAQGISNEESKVKLVSEKQPMHEFTKPENIGALAVFPASEAASTITGSSYSIDGGWVAQ